MTNGKSALLALWLGLIFIACALPLGLLIKSVANAPPMRFTPFALVCLLLVGGAVAFLALNGAPPMTSPLVLSLPFVASFFGATAGVPLGGLAALPLLAAVTWWAPEMALGWPSALFFLVAGVFASALPRWSPTEAGPSPIPIFVTLLGLAAIATLQLGQLGSPLGFWVAWHHWGAYVAPVQAMTAGGVPFRDFPVQYGMGPTLLIAALSSGDAWWGTYLAVVCVNTLYLIALGASINLALREAPRGLALLATLALVCTVLLWTGYPPDELGWMSTPSTGGMRFLPLALLVLLILRSEAVNRPVTAPGYAVWLLSLAWSPEAGVYATIVWFPYLGLRTAQARGADSVGAIAWVALRGAVVAVAALFVAAGVLTLLFRTGFGDWPSVSGFLTYIVNPPGALPPNPKGPVWLALATLAIGLAALVRAGARRLRAVMVCNLALIAVSSYYLLGRSHDNNVLNLFPFVALMLSAALSVELPSILTGFSRMVLAGMIAWTATFGFQSVAASFRNGDALAIGPVRLIDRFRLATPDAWRLLDAYLANQGGQHANSADAGSALAWLAEQGGGPPLIVSPAMIMPRYQAGPTWTGVNNLANFDLLPRDVVADFIRNGAAAYRRPGWLLVDRTRPESWLDLFGSAYAVTEERVFGGYTAYRMVPK
jgi:hypothetical protein